jgi:hypothetical protein
MSSRLLTRAALVAAVAALGAPGTAGAAFSVVPSPNAFSGDNLLNGVSASSPADAWAVGSLCCSIRNSGTGALTEHWDGQAWTAVLGPDARFQDETLNGVDDIAPSDAWAVGRVKQSGYGGGTPLILHWDGAGWQTVAPPAGVTGELRAVSRDWAGGAWAVGDDGHGHPLALRCTAAACASVTIPQVGAVSRLRGIKAFAADDAWAVGDTGNMTLVVHWNGVSWSVVPSPNPDPNVNVLLAVGGVAGDDLWAVGRMARNYADTGVPPGTRALAMHWDGTSWSVAGTPNSGYQDSLNGVAATGTAAVTAVGTFQDVDAGGMLRTLGERWNGSSWTRPDTPNVGQADNLLRGAAAIPGTSDVWAVGEHLTAGGGPVQTLVLRDSGGATGGVDSQAAADGTAPDGPTQPTPPGEPLAPSDSTTPSGPAPHPAAQAAPPGETCGPVRVTLALGNAGLRARRIRVTAAGRQRLLMGPRKRLTVKVPYTGAEHERLSVRIRQRGGKVRTIKRTVSLCRPAS